MSDSWIWVGENGLDAESRKFAITQIYLTLRDVLAVHNCDLRWLGAQHSVTVSKTQAERFRERKRSELSQWLGSRDFHSLCDAVDFNAGRSAQYFYDILNGCPEAIDMYAKVAAGGALDRTTTHGETQTSTSS